MRFIRSWSCMMYPRWFILMAKNFLFLSFRRTPLFRWSVRTYQRWAVRSYDVLENTTISTKTLNKAGWFSLQSIIAINICIVLDALCNSKSTRVEWNNPWWDLNALLSPSESSISICKYLLSVTGVVKMITSLCESKHSYMREKGYNYCVVTLFCLQKSTQNRKVPFLEWRQ